MSSTLLGITGQDILTLFSLTDALPHISLPVIITLVFCVKRKAQMHDGIVDSDGALQVIIWHVIPHGFPYEGTKHPLMLESVVLFYCSKAL